MTGFSLSQVASCLITLAIMFYIPKQQAIFFFKNRNQPHFRYCPIIFVLIFLLLVILHTLLISSYFIYLFSRSLFAYLFSLVSSMYPVTTGCGKAQFPDRDHLNSPSSPHHQGSTLGLHYIVSLIRIYRTVAGRLSSSASERKRCPAVTSFRCVNRQQNDLWPQSINIIFAFQAVSLD